MRPPPRPQAAIPPAVEAAVAIRVEKTRCST
jgi:hypothetical protein